MTTAIVLSGLTPYLDQWHGLEATSRRVSELLTGWGFDVDISADLGAAVDADPDLLLVNLAGRGSSEDPHLEQNARALSAVRDGSLPVLALHASAIAFAGVPEWEHVIGGRWMPGVSGHPQIGHSVILPGERHPITEGLGPFVVYDERYSHLSRSAGTPVAAHVEDGIRHDLAWAIEDPDSGRRAVYDGLGHGVESYDSTGRVEFLRRSVSWVTRREIGS